MGEEFVSDDEFHETFEDIIPSSSGSDADEEAAGSSNNTMRITTKLSEHDAAPIWTPTSFQSKFSIWKDDPLSITERRQRFFKQKGLRSSRDEPLTFTDTGSQTSRFFDEEDDDDEQLVKPTCEKCGGKKKGCAHENSAIATTDWGSSNGYKASKQEEDTGENLQSAKCSSSPDEKTCDCIDKNCNYNSNSSIERPDSSSFSSFDEPKQQQQQQHRASSSHENLDEVMSAIENIMEERLKIRDLDSGKEFLMKRFNRDGSLNMLREVATGKDLTLAEFEQKLGLFSPVAQELHRREQRSSTIEAPKKASDGKPPVVTKRKSWLKKLKGALKTKERSGGSARSSVPFDTSSQRSVDDTDTSSQMGSISGDGSPKRDSSFAGLDRNEFTKRGSLPKEYDEGFSWRKAQKVKVKLRQKSNRELNDLHLCQEILAHQGAIWTMKFSPDGRYLASAGQDRVVHVWEVVDHPLMAESDISKGDGELGSMKLDSDGSVKAGQDRSMSKIDKEGSTKGGKVSLPRLLKSSNNHSKSPAPVPKLFWLSEKPLCSFRGHTEDILDLSWSRSQFLLSSSMDKTVRLWHISYDECLRVFSHNDYVTCAQFNPLDDRYFLSGSLDDRVRIWSIPEQHVVDWSDLQEMVTAVCYTPDGKKVIVGSYKGTCRFYNATGNKLQLDAHIDVREENKKARGKKITGLHCMPGDPQKILVTSNDSRIRVYDGLNLVAKYKGLRNVKSQIASSFSPAGDFIISASEDSRVIVWNSGNRDVSNKTSIYRRDKQLSCEEFAARHVSVAIAWPGSSTPQLNSFSQTMASSEEAHPHEPTESPTDENGATKASEEHNNSKCPSYCLGRSPLGIFGSGRKNSVAVADDHHLDVSSMEPDASPPPARRSSFFPECGPKGGSATWPEEKLAGSHQQQQQQQPNGEMNGGGTPPVEFVSSNTVSAAWGLVIVTAGLGGEITTFQNYGFPVRL